MAVPAKELFFTWGPGEVFVFARVLRSVIDKGCLFLLSRISSGGFELLSSYRNVDKDAI